MPIDRSFEGGVISDVVRDEEDERLRKLLNPFEESGWKTTMKLVMDDIYRKPGWLIDGGLIRDAWSSESLGRLSKQEIRKLDDLQSITRVRDWRGGDCEYMLRFLEVFSEIYDYPYVWRGGEIDDIDGKAQGTYTFYAEVAKDYVFSGFFNSKRKNPCLIGLPVKAIVRDFLDRKGSVNFMAEHGFDGMIDGSFDLIIPNRTPEGTMVYLP